MNAEIMSNIKIKLSILSFLEYAVWGSYLVSMGIFFTNRGLGTNVGFLFAIQGLVALVVPTFVGYVADKWLSPLKMFRICHAIVLTGLVSIGWYALSQGTFFVVYALLFLIVSAGYIPTISLCNSLCFQELSSRGLDTVNNFPAIRACGTFGFVVSMWIVNLMKSHLTGLFFLQGALFALLILLSSLLLQDENNNRSNERTPFSLSPLKEPSLAVLLLFSFFVGISLHLSEAYNGPFIDSFAADVEFRDLFFVRNSVLLLSLSQLSEACVIFLIPFFMNRYSIKGVYAIGIVSWIVHFILLAVATPRMPSVLLIILSMLIYGLSFNLYSTATSLYIDKHVPGNIRSSAQGFVILFCNGVGGTIGIVACQFVVNRFTDSQVVDGVSYLIGNWPAIWMIFAMYMTVVLILFLFLYRKNSIK